MALQQIQHRRDTVANWTTINPVLLDGEIGIEKDTGREKYGDGSTAWNALPYRLSTPSWSAIRDYALLGKDPVAADRQRWIAAEEAVARALGWVIVTDPQWGAVPGTDCTAAIQKALDYIDGFDPATRTYVATRGGTIFFPTPLRSGADYLTSKCLVGSARINWIGGSGGSFGGASSCIAAIPGGDFTNTNSASGSTGLDPGMPWMIRLARTSRSENEWWHAGSFQNLQVDASGVFTGGVVGLGAGEISTVDRVHISGTGVQARTVSDAVFNGTTTVTSALAQFDVLEDMAAKLDSAAIPAWNANVAVTDAVTVSNSPVITSPSNGFANAQVGMEVVAGNSGFRGTNYVVSVDSPGQITMAFPLNPITDSNGGTGKTITLGRPREFRIEQIIDGQTIRVNRPIPATGTTQNLTIYRPRPGMRWYGGTATGNIRSLNVVSCSGAGTEWVGGAVNYVMNIAGDNNGGALVRFHKVSTAGDPVTTVLSSFKSENNNYGDTSLQQYENYADHDPPILIDYCGMFNLEVEGGDAYAGDRGNRDLIRIQQSNGLWQDGWPSVTIKGLEATNPWNPSFDNLIRDVDTGKAVPGSSQFLPTFGGRYYPMVKWNKDDITYGDLYVRKVGNTGLGGNLTVEGDLTVLGRVATGSTPDPQSFSWMWDEPPSNVVLGSYNKTVLSAQSGGRYGIAYPTGGAINSEWRWRVPVSAGTWSFYLVYEKDPTYGITKFQISYDNGTTWTTILTVDMYAAAATYNQVSGPTSFTVPSTGIALFRTLVDNKNANATTYFWAISFFRLYRTA